MRALIYARVSSDPTGRGRSVADQIVECRDLCARNGWTIADELQDNDIGASRWSRKDRPEYGRLHSLLATVDVLVTWEASRANRDLATYLELRDLCAEHSVLWSYSGKTHDLTKGDDRFTTGLDALLSEREAEVIRERVLRGLNSRAAAGEPHGKVPYGYRAAFDDAGRKIRVPDPDEAAVLRDSHKTLREGNTLRSIVRQLNDDGRLNRGRPWTSVELRRKLLSPTYAGWRVHKGNRVAATWEAIFTDDEHDAITAILTNPVRLTQHGSAPVHLLTGIAECGKCGGRVGRTKNGASGTDSYCCRKGFCMARRKNIVDEVVEAVLIARLSRPDIHELLANVTEDGSELREARTQIRTLQARLTQFEEKAIAGQLEPDEYVRLREGIRRRIEVAEARARAAAPAKSPVVARIAGPEAAETWRTLPIENRREVVRSLMRVFIDPAPQSEITNPEYVRIEWKM